MRGDQCDFPSILHCKCTTRARTADSAVLNAMMRARGRPACTTHALRTLVRQTTAPCCFRSRSRYSNPTEHVITTVREACMSVPSVRPSEGSPCRTPPALPLSDSPLHPRPLTHGTPHARGIHRACSPLVAAPALPAASRHVPHRFASGLLQSRVRPPPRPHMDPTGSRRSPAAAASSVGL